MRLGEKLLQIRTGLGLSQTEIWRRLDLEGKNRYTIISSYERGTQEPSLITVLKYAQLAGVSMETIVDDTKDLPKKFK